MTQRRLIRIRPATGIAVTLAALLVGSLTAGPAGAVSPAGLVGPVGAVGIVGQAESRTATAIRAAALREVPVPSHSADTTRIQLYGSSADGSAVQQYTSGVPLILAGPNRTRLAPTRSQGMLLELLGTVGPISSWTATKDPSDPVSQSQLHRLNVATGAETVTEPADDPVAGTRDGWIGYTLKGRLVGHTMSGKSKELLRGLKERPQVVADATRALVASNHWDKNRKVRIFQLRLITLSTGKVRTIVSGTKSITEPALSATTVAWFGDNKPGQSGERTIYRRGRDGGKVTSYAEPNWPQSSLAVAGNQVGWLAYRTTSSGTSWYMRVFNGKKAIRVDLPGPAQGIAGAGTRLITATGGKLSTAGVYAVGNRAERVATVPASLAEYRSGSMSAGRTWLLDTSLTDKAGGPIWQRQVAGASEPVLSAETLVGPRARTGQRVNISAGRAVSGSPAGDGQYQILDRGKVTHTLKFGPDDEVLELQASGPYFSFGYSIYDAAGTRVLSTFDVGAYDVQLFGSRMAYATGDAVLVRDLARPLSATNPAKVADCTGCGQVTIWGNTVAWFTPAGLLQIGQLGETTLRTVDLDNESFGPQLAEGSITWRERVVNQYVAHSLDLTSPTSEPVDLGTVDPLAVDGHWVLAQQTAGTRAVSVLRLPFGQDQSGRLIGTVAAASFTPSGPSTPGQAGALAVWQPQFDISKPMVDVALRITTADGQSVRTLTGTAPDGSIRDLSWDGKDDVGTVVPDGAYTWTLTAQNQDGEGHLIDWDGGQSVSGSLTVLRS